MICRQARRWLRRAGVLLSVCSSTACGAVVSAERDVAYVDASVIDSGPSEAATADSPGDSVCLGGRSPAQCGPRCVVCPSLANSTATCDGTTCGAECNAGFADCDAVRENGCETSLADTIQHCGACGRVCTAPMNATARCSGGECSAQCDVGFELRGPTCERIPIRLLYPQSTAFALDDRPMFRWQNPGGIDSFRVDVDVRPDFSMLASAGASGTSSSAEWRVDRSLRPGVSYFWRVVGEVAGREVSRSQTWFFRAVAPRPAPPREQLHQVTTDIDCDGVEDVVVSRGSSEADYGLYVYSMDQLVRGPTTIAPTVIRTSVPARRAVSVSAVGDVDGDGCSDLVAGAGTDTDLVFGSRTRSYEAIRFAAPMGLAIAQQIGDVNGDGFADVLMLDRSAPSTLAVPYVFFGGASRAGIVSNRAAFLPSGLREPVVLRFATADLDLDGSNEIAARSSPDFTEQGWYRFNRASRAFELARPLGHSDVRRIVGDVNGDGYLDYAGAERAELYLGGPSGPSDTALALVPESRRPVSGFLAEGDFDHDGIDDIVAKVFPASAPYLVGVAVFLGSASATELARSDAEYSVLGIPFSAPSPAFQHVWRAKRLDAVPYIAMGAVRPHSFALVPLLLSTPTAGTTAPVRVVPTSDAESSVEFFALAPRFVSDPITPLSPASLAPWRSRGGGRLRVIGG